MINFMKLTFNNFSTLFKCDPSLFSIMEYSQNYRQQLIEKIVDFGNTTEYEILHNDNMESDSQSSNEDNCSSSDSCSDMDVDNTEEQKEQNISKQEQIDRKHLFTILTMIKI